MKLKELYRKNAYGVMGALIFHIFLVTGFWLAELDLNTVPKSEEAVLLDFTAPDKKEEPELMKQEQTQENKSDVTAAQTYRNATSNRAVNDAARKDKFFDKSYQQEIEDAKKLVDNVNSQLAKKSTPVKRYEMPEATTAGQNRDSIKNVVYSGKSNIHYFLENRYHLKLPIPVYLAKGGGKITIEIEVDRDGNVLKAKIKSNKDIADPMLPEYAIQAAERTKFNADPKAPAIQKGTITYEFVAQ